MPFISPFTTLGGVSGSSGSSSGVNMNWLYGDGSDGDFILNEGPTAWDEPKNFKNFTLMAGVTLTKATPGSPMVIYCQETCEINGTIDLTGKGFVSAANKFNGYDERIAGITNINKGGEALYSGGNFDKEIHTLLARGLNFGEIASMGGAGGYCESSRDPSSIGSSYKFHPYNAGSGSAGGGGGWGDGSIETLGENIQTYYGGSGGGGLFIFARNFVFNNSGSIISNGTNAAVVQLSVSFGNRYVCPAGGGGAGSATIICENFTNEGTFQFNGGKGGYSMSQNYPSDNDFRSNGGNGGYVIIQLPS